MSKTTTFKIANTSNSNNSFLGTNYSKILDNIIIANIKDTNPYLHKSYNKDYDEISAIIADSKKKHSFGLFDGYLNENDKFLKAANFIANYGKTTYKTLPFTYGKTYELIDGTPICFYDDEIQIGMDLYSYDSFSNTAFLKTLSAPTKKIIINILNAGNKNITINII